MRFDSNKIDSLSIDEKGYANKQKSKEFRPSGSVKFKPDSNLKLLDQVRQVLRYYHYAYRTEQTYCKWIVKFIQFHNCKTHPKFMGKTEIETYLSHLASNLKVAASTQKQALNSIIFLYKYVLDISIEDEIAFTRSKRKVRPPVVMTQDEIRQVLSHMQGVNLLMARLLYGSGLRLMECIRMRVRGLDFNKKLVYVHMAKGAKDRTTVFPQSLHADLKDQVAKVKMLHEEDLKNGHGEVYIPEALSRKYTGAATELGW